MYCHTLSEVRSVSAGLIHTSLFMPLYLNIYIVIHTENYDVRLEYDRSALIFIKAIHSQYDHNINKKKVSPYLSLF